MKKVAVVLFNLGGPDGPAAVRPFLFNLFNDPAIIGLPAVARTPLAALISSRREKLAQANYDIMGGGSPLLPETERQAEALTEALRRRLPEAETRCFIAMRYWKPFTADAARAAAEWGPDEVVLLPLYPQFSTTTTGSSLNAWARSYRGSGRTRSLCCYPDADGFVGAYARLIDETHAKAGRPPVRLLLSAHGLPERVVQRGDPYQAQVEATAAAIVRRLPGEWDARVCFQSRVGPLKWIGPSTEEEVRRAGQEGAGVLLAPIAFVSEHVETLVELDHEYAALGREAGCPVYLRAPAVSLAREFIEELTDAVEGALGREGVATHTGGRWCPAKWSRCPSTCPVRREAAA